MDRPNPEPATLLITDSHFNNFISRIRNNQPASGVKSSQGGETMKQRSWLLLAFALNLSAADFTGTWKGTASQDDNGQNTSHPLSVKLVQTGTTLKGTTFTDGAEPIPLDGAVEGSRITLRLKTASELVTFELHLEGTHLKGKLTSQHGGQSQTSTLDLIKSSS
jgi:hypothetical protein